MTPGTRPAPRHLRSAVVSALIGMVMISAWAGLWVRSQGHPVALIGPGTYTSAWPLLEEEVGIDIGWRIKGHDGGMFYAVARSPLDPEKASAWLDYPSYRERRILYPLLGWALAPGGGMPLVYALLAVTVLSVGLGAASCSLLPRRPGWLPVVVALTPGVVVSALVGLCDGLVTGLILAAFASSYHRRWGLLVAFVVTATMTRESSLLAAAALAFAPGMPRRFRILTVAAPLVTLGAWMIWVDAMLPSGSDTHALNQFAFPFSAWVGSNATSLAMGALSMLALLLAARRLGREDLHVTLFLLLTLLLSAVLSHEVTISWVNTSRVVAPAIPLAMWALFRSDPEPEEPGTPGDDPGSVAGLIGDPAPAALPA